MIKRRVRFFGGDNKNIRRRMRRTTKQYIIVAFICIIVLGGAAAFTSLVVTSQIKDKYATQLANAKQEIEANKKAVYVATTDITPGDYLTADNVTSQTAYATQPIETYITAEDIGKVALINISTGTHVLKTMLSGNAISSELRETEYTVININSNIVDNDTVDIRISFPNGEDYVVLSKKVIKGMTIDADTCFFWLTEEEILRMASATVDAHLYEGSKIYTTKYIEPDLQKASLVTYEPSISTLLLIQDNPNIVETATSEISQQVRKAMENRLAKSIGTDVQAIEWELDPNGIETDNENSTVLQDDNTVTYQDELKDKEVELDYGP